MHLRRLFPTVKAIAFVTTAASAGANSLTPAQTAPFSAKVVVETENSVGTMEHRRLGGTNLALWNEERHFQDPLLRKWVDELGTGLIRLPGGSWSNGYYWNGNGVRNAKGDINVNAVGPDGYPSVDYSDYKPGFMVDTKTLKPYNGFHGNVDIKTLHDYVKATPGAVALPSLNAGTGRAVDAAEWARWAMKQGYESAYWHVGNELGGSWEPGTFLPDGSTITPEIFVQRFNAIADAVHAVDPKAKLGAFAFAEDTLKHSGDRVAFASIHTYPGSTTLTAQQNLARVPETVAREVGQVRGWIEKYQPTRKDQIEIGYTEWNLSGGMNASDLFSGLWTSMMLGEFARNDVDFATKWDTFTHVRGMADGHGLIWTDGGKYTRKAAYYALQLWNHYNGDQVLRPAVTGEDTLYSYASRDTDALYIMFVNPSNDRPANVEVELPGFLAGSLGEQITLSHREYFWNYRTHLPEWSQPPRASAIGVGDAFSVSVPPFSVSYVRVPTIGAPEESKFMQAQAPAANDKTAPRLRFMLPPEIFAGDRIAGYLHAEDAATGRPYAGNLPPATLKADGPVTLDRENVRLAETLGRFEFVANSAEPVTFRASVNGAEVTARIEPKSSEPRPLLIWDFQSQSPTEKGLFESRYTLSADLNQRANKEVARIDFSPDSVTLGDKEHKTIFRINRLPERSVLNRANIRGVFFDIKTLGLATEDPNASVSVVMQSPANWWMVLGTVPLAGNTDWKRHQVTFSRQDYVDAIASGYNIWFVLNTDKPLVGTILLDRIGFMAR
ncbi:MAG: Endoglucanase [Verrucomicrobiota bacterium]